MNVDIQKGSCGLASWDRPSSTAWQVGSLKLMLGLSLVELLVSMALASILMLGILQIFSASKRSFELTQDLSVLQEKGHLAISTLAEHIQMADYWGGVGAKSVFFGTRVLSTSRGDCSAEWLLQSSPSLVGFKGSGSVSGIANFPDDCLRSEEYLPGSDLLLVRNSDGQASIPDTTIDNKSQRKRYFVRSEVGGTAYVFQGRDSVSAFKKIPTNDMVHNRALLANLFFLRPCSLVVNQICRDDIPTLVRLSLSGNRFVTQALVEGIEQLHFSFGIDTDADQTVDRYVSADLVPVWEHVISVQISLIVRSLEKDLSIDLSGKTYALGHEGGDSVNTFVVTDEGGQYRHRLFKREVVLRNRVYDPS